MSSQPPGWYPDAQGQQRYWDGNQWTEHVGGAGAGAAATSPPSPLLLVALALAAVTIIGNFVPWATLGELSAAGIDGTDGKIVIGLMALAIVALLVGARGARKGFYITAMVFAALAAGVGALNVTDIQDRGLDFGAGIFMVIGGAIAFIVVCIVMAAQSRR
jgi:hypothetical protein